MQLCLALVRSIFEKYYGDEPAKHESPRERVRHFRRDPWNNQARRSEQNCQRVQDEHGTPLAKSDV